MSTNTAVMSNICDVSAVCPHTSNRCCAIDHDDTFVTHTCAGPSESNTAMCEALHWAGVTTTGTASAETTWVIHCKRSGPPLSDRYLEVLICAKHGWQLLLNYCLEGSASHQGTYSLGKVLCEVLVDDVVICPRNWVNAIKAHILKRQPLKGSVGRAPRSVSCNRR